MTRWLAAARSAQTAPLPPADKTDNTDRTQAPAAPPKGHPVPVLSVLSVLSERGLPAQPSPRAAIIRAMEGGASTPGAIATAARLGATVTYQELDRMRAEGHVILQHHGALVLTTSAALEGRA